MSNVLPFTTMPETSRAQAQAALVALENAVHVLQCMPAADVAQLIFQPRAVEEPPVWRLDQIRKALVDYRKEVQEEAEKLFNVAMR